MNIHDLQAAARSGRWRRNWSCRLCSDLNNQSGLVTLTFDLLTLKVVSESRVMGATSVPILVVLGFSVLELGPMYATDRQTSDKIKRRLMPTPIRGGGIILASL